MISKFKKIFISNKEELKDPPKYDIRSSLNVKYEFVYNQQWAYKRDLITGSYRKSSQSNDVIYNFHNGLLDSVLNGSYITLRPDDFWFAIISQFTTLLPYKLRKTINPCTDLYIVIGDKKKLSIEDQIIEQVSAQFNPIIASWFIPDFSTTTKKDIINAYMTMIGTKEPNSINNDIIPNIPSIRLAGTKEDYQKLRTLIDKMLPFSPNIKPWHVFLCYICDYLTQNPNDKFLNISCHTDHINKQISGWICMFLTVPTTTKSWVKLNYNQIPSSYYSYKVKITSYGIKMNGILYTGSWCCDVYNNQSQPRTDWLLYEVLY